MTRSARGIATVYQDLAMIPLLSIWRNFFLGSEPTKGWGPFRRFDVKKAKEITREEMSKMGIDVRDPEQPSGRSRAASASRSRSPVPCTSARGS